MSAVLFDFDGTLVRGDSIGFYLRHHLLADGPLRRGAAIVALPLMLPTLLWWRSAMLGGGFYGWLGSVGRDDAALLARRDAWLAGAKAAREKLVIEPAWRALREHRSRGERVIVVTGAETGLARALWQALDGPEVEFVGSRVRRGLGGHLPVEHCVGPRKLTALARIGVHPPFAAMYSDSARDLPLLRLARRAVMVEASTSNLRRVRRELPTVEVLATDGSRGEASAP